MTSTETWENSFREKYTKKSDPSGYGIMTMWKSGEDPEDAINVIREIEKEAYARGRRDTVEHILERMKKEGRGGIAIMGIIQEAAQEEGNIL